MTAKWGKPCHMHAVRCPHCGKPNDFREVSDALAEEDGRPTVECDHCHGIMEVVKIQPTTLIWVRPGKGGSDHQVLTAGQVVYRCTNQECLAEFYDSMPTTNNFGEDIPAGTCPTCGQGLQQVT